MKALDKSRWSVLSPMLDRLLDADEPERATLLADIRRENPMVAAELVALLDKHRAIEQSNFLQGALLGPITEPSLAGQQVGNYTLESLLGRGGMGSVWLAHRSDGRYESQVAIKFLNLALFGRDGVNRFRREGQALARLTHVNIARLLDAGVTSDEQPYLVLEYVEGEAIDRWRRSRELDVTTCVQLFLQVLDAVAHAHSKLILHRDLKPSNILVTAEGQVKLLDFGVAKLLGEVDERLTADLLTHVPGRGFTPGYAAPEQITGGEVTTATDVYALGVLLYLLLTGGHPTTTPGQTPVERLRAVMETDPPRPSEAVEAQAYVARTLRGDLDNIVAKALKKSPSERYQTVQAFAEDLRRHLNQEPVSARADSFWYRTGKFVARNRSAVGAAALALAAILGGAGVALWQAHEASRERDYARSVLARHAAVVNFVSTMLTEVAPIEQPVRIGELLERSQAMLLPTESNPEGRAAILALISDYYQSSTKAGPLLSRAIELTRNSTDSILRGSILCRSALAALSGSPGDAKTLAAEGLALSAGDTRESINCLQTLSAVAQSSGDGHAALDLTLRSQSLLRASGMKAADIEIWLFRDAASDYYMQGDLIGADRFNARAHAELMAAGLGQSKISLSIHNNWGRTRLSAGDDLRALQILDEGVQAATTRWPGDGMPEWLLGNHGSVLHRLARYDEALISFDKAVAAAEGNNSRLLSLIRGRRAATYIELGNLSAAEQELTALLPKIGATIPHDERDAVAIRDARARLDTARGNLAAALSSYTENVRSLGEHPAIAAPLIQTLVARAEVYLRLHQPAQALADAQRALDLARDVRRPNAHSSFVGESLLMRARVQESLGQHAEARASAAEAVSHLAPTLGAQHPLTVSARSLAS